MVRKGMHGLRSSAMPAAQPTRAVSRRHSVAGGFAKGSVANLAAAAHHIFVAGQLRHADRTARMKFGGADADFSTHAEFAAVGKLRRGIVQHDGTVDPVEKP